jgi:SpoIIAA-like
VPQVREQEATLIRRLHEDGSGNVLGYEVSGKLTEEELRTISEELRAVVAEHGKVRLLVRMRQIPRMELGALAEDLKLMPYAKDIECYAVVSDSAIFEWTEKIVDAFVGGEVKRFEDSRYEEAWRWVRS